jgi:glycosyltransferase involved in cell wall biosynthesis
VVIDDQTAMRRHETPAVGLGKQPAASLVVASILRLEGTTGVHTHVREMQQELQSHGISVEIVTPFSAGRALSLPVMGLRLGIERLSSAASVAWYYHWHEVFLRRALRRRLRGIGPAVVYAQGPREARAALEARDPATQRVVMVVHYMTSQADEWVDKERLRRGGAMFEHLRRIEATAISRVDGIVYVSDASRRSLLSWLPDAEEIRSAVIPNFVRRDVGGGPAAPIGDLVTVGSLLQAKNHRYLLDVLVEAKRSGRVYTLDIIGDGPMRRTLERMARSLGVASQVRFRGVRNDVRQLLPGYKAYVHTSYRESLPLVIIEAAAAGLPVVVADTGGVREICDERHGATLWPLGEAGKAAAILIGLMEDDEAMARAVAASHARFRDAFDADVVLPRLTRFLFDPELETVRSHVVDDRFAVNDAMAVGALRPESLAGGLRRPALDGPVRL